METVVGIVCEYNPFHNGHLYHINETRRRTAADAVVCAMSGDFVQRGAPAVMDKWDRAGIALRHGADVVFEIPVRYALGTASVYAAAGVRMLESLGAVTHLSFGSECGNVGTLQRVAQRLADGGAPLEERIRDLGRTGLSYPAAREAAYFERYSNAPSVREDLAVLRSPNDLLAVSYLSACRSLQPIAIPRMGAGHDEITSTEEPYLSASQLRQELQGGKDISASVPYDPSGVPFYNAEDKLFDIVRYRLLTIDPDTISFAPSGGEGLGNRLVEAARYASDLDDLILRTKSKRYTYTHVSRLIMELLLDIRNDEPSATEPGYLRVLGATAKGRKLLGAVRRKGENQLPIITNINKERGAFTGNALADLDLDIRAADLYHLLCGQEIAQKSDYKITPIMVDKS
ncbi:MAG: nucleotidyltransferase family protein [Mogibacterium sp.]|nr:nucleotidyltransferase family protein [Mogibacterium sp.]